MRARGWTVRARLTVLYGCLVFLAGAALLAVVYYLLDRSVANQPIEVPVVSVVDTGGDQAAVELKQRQAAAEAQMRESFRQRTVLPLLERSLIALGGLTVAGLAAGWLIAGRTLRPIHRITTTARRVADRNLHERIALGGPRDELRELADTFDDMLSRLDAAFEGQRQFVGNASHELKTPLAINRTLLEVAMNRSDTPPALRQLGETLLEVNSRHERLVDGLLTLARSEHTIANPMPVDLAEVAGDVIGHARHESERLDVSVALEASAAPVCGDPLLLERLVQNLVHNAVRHNRAGGWVRVVVEADNHAARLVVANTGRPVPAASIASIFEPFQRITSRVGSTRGTGLGLSIVRSVVRAHGGSVSAKARAEGGLVVEVSLPAEAAG
ncbi:MAG TPA: HAMP domain-containing sensor histidine kinase [Actinophytocola sp.]|uniref:sensor histidine kinase n=1 Tax=Actinophytocola sp. TaxID=1872138 RepID=UPI002DDCA697|nr:HAMP domain-containing sensor histidine kinase [Actinophytocola sp.]HEV2779615.1 HAMP domain-containing sensor histidine kinase [Actinophytocola sp.]